MENATKLGVAMMGPPVMSTINTGLNLIAKNASGKRMDLKDSRVKLLQMKKERGEAEVDLERAKQRKAKLKLKGPTQEEVEDGVGEWNFHFEGNVNDFDKAVNEQMVGYQQRPALTD